MGAPDVEVAIVVLTDRQGRVLMQHRDADAPTSPGRWTPPGGRLEPGEDALAAAHRELLEETGLRAALSAAGTVDHVRDDGALVRFHVFSGQTDATDGDVVLGEGQAMVFLARRQLDALALSTNARRFLDLAFPDPMPGSGSR